MYLVNRFLWIDGSGEERECEVFKLFSCCCAIYFCLYCRVNKVCVMLGFPLPYIPYLCKESAAKEIQRVKLFSSQKDQGCTSYTILNDLRYKVTTDHPGNP